MCICLVCFHWHCLVHFTRSVCVCVCVDCTQDSGLNHCIHLYMLCTHTHSCGSVWGVVMLINIEIAFKVLLAVYVVKLCISLFAIIDYIPYEYVWIWFVLFAFVFFNKFCCCFHLIRMTKKFVEWLILENSLTFCCPDVSRFTDTVKTNLKLKTDKQLHSWQSNLDQIGFLVKTWFSGLFIQAVNALYCNVREYFLSTLWKHLIS